MGYRFATLALALLAAAPALAQTKSADEPGPMTVDAEHIEGVSEIEFTARGNAEIKRDELSIFGDVLRYNAEFGRIEGDGTRIEINYSFSFVSYVLDYPYNGYRNQYAF